MSAMASPPRPDRPNRSGYAYLTHRPLNNLLFILPALLFFQVGSMAYDSNLLAPRHLGRLLRFFGGTAPYLPALLIVVVLLVQHVIRRDRWRAQPWVLVGMLGESLGWVLPLIAMSHVTGKAFLPVAAGPVAGPSCQAVTTAAAPGLMHQVLLAVGAGIYEEFIFRLALVSLALLVFVDVFELPRDGVALAAVGVAAVLFSFYHLSLAQLANWSNFPAFALVFRMLAGAYLGGLYLLRGFGVAVGTHTLWNLLLVVFDHGG
jgi:membrane protease YdiL (CAAX protease family)